MTSVLDEGMVLVFAGRDPECRRCRPAAPAVDQPVRALFGRESEQRRLGDFVDGAGRGGGAMLVRGEAGIGKSALLQDTAMTATARGMRILRTAGVESETHMPFAGLHQLLLPLRGEIRDLPVPQREALGAAFGLADSRVPDPFLIALAALNLLGEAAARSPVLLLVEDAHWLDRASADVLAFVARRLDAEPIVLLAALRDGFYSPLDRAGLPELVLERLDDTAATALLDSCSPTLTPVMRTRLLREAAGHPLALVELPIAVDTREGEAPLRPGWLALTTRLEQAFTARMSGLPPAARTMLLVAALNDSSALSEILDATAQLTGVPVTADDLAPAVAVRLVDVHEAGVSFRHPLMRSAIYQEAGISRRHAVHAALADVLTARPDRRLWHRAASAVRPDESIAAELAATARNVRRRGDLLSAVAALEHAARLSEDAAHRRERLVRAAEYAAEIGRRDIVARLLGECERLQPSARQRARIVWIRENFEDGIGDDSAAAHSLADLAETMAAQGDVELALKLLSSASLRCFWAHTDERSRRRVVGVAESLPVDELDGRLLTVLAFAAPLERGEVVVERLRRLAARPAGDRPATRLLGSSALMVGAFDLSEEFCAASLPALRAQGRLSLLARDLGAQAWSAARLADLSVAIPAAEEAARLAQETSQPLMHAIAQASGAVLAALRGELDRVEGLAVAAEQVALPLGARPVLATVQHARGLAALGEGRHADAFGHLRRMHDPADPAFHQALRCFSVAELADAAVHSGQGRAVAGIIEELEAVALITPSPSLHADLRYARAVLADEAAAEPFFEAALRADLSRWPFVRARVQLAYGEWLRRRRRTAESRAPLRTARETFDALGVIPWSERARRELRASGESSGSRSSAARDVLTAQELQIAQMAADGLTNREIGEKLYLSHRTVGSHLYRIFPKLGITSRSALRAALAVRS
ncbi:LuxR family transcriptional regulator [Sphaerisporangium rufum]|uniref:LuxR family transcriptional regulator n=1 Tax=Sphaerisporangium rufum TaxID=1381558 RepID=A0A919V1T2_9ACTN|nr:LuxR family transcriptional regulator [Sphaerisporangium rufum]GII78957.1 LuxR family transcriptional regulator [Sphaerisporangium rufum]